MLKRISYYQAISWNDREETTLKSDKAKWKYILKYTY